MFRKLLKLRHKALKFLRIQIGNGSDTFFWWDPWTPFGTLYHYLGSDGPTRLGIPLCSTVSDLFSVSGGWSLPAARTEKQVHLLTFLSTVNLSHFPDLPVWSIDDCSQKSFISKLVWDSMRIRKTPVLWSGIIWHKASIPHHAFNAWLFMLNRNPTFERIAVWGLDIELTCLLCGAENESRNHLFFDCVFSRTVWIRTVAVLRLTSPPPPVLWGDIIELLPLASTNSITSLALLQAWQGCLYEIWRERNRRVHQGTTLPPLVLVKNLVSSLKLKCLAMLQNGSSLASTLIDRWSHG